MCISPLQLCPLIICENSYRQQNQEILLYREISPYFLVYVYYLHMSWDIGQYTRNTFSDLAYKHAANIVIPRDYYSMIKMKRTVGYSQRSFS